MINFMWADALASSKVAVQTRLHVWRGYSVFREKFRPIKLASKFMLIAFSVHMLFDFTAQNY